MSYRRFRGFGRCGREEGVRSIYVVEMGCEGKRGVRWLCVLFAVERDWRN
jgi:hypothetical protein